VVEVLTSNGVESFTTLTNVCGEHHHGFAFPLVPAGFHPTGR
jgi:hypothetical protein